MWTPLLKTKHHLSRSTSQKRHPLLSHQHGRLIDDSVRQSMGKVDSLIYPRLLSMTDITAIEAILSLYLCGNTSNRLPDKWAISHNKTRVKPQTGCECGLGHSGIKTQEETEQLKRIKQTWSSDCGSSQPKQFLWLIIIIALGISSR